MNEMVQEDMLSGANSLKWLDLLSSKIEWSLSRRDQARVSVEKGSSKGLSGVQSRGRQRTYTCLNTCKQLANGCPNR